MRLIAILIFAGSLLGCGAPEVTSDVTIETPSTTTTQVPPAITWPEARADVLADKFAVLALTCVRQEYPNKISHVMNSDSDAQPPRQLTPAFYGCFDWHSSVHGHWLLARILALDPQTPYRDAILASLYANITEENIAQEVAYYTAKERSSFERPYGIAWLLQLVTELEQSDSEELHVLRQRLIPLEAAIVAQVSGWLPKLAYPIRLGTHNQSAFAFGLMLDYARQVGNTDLETLLVDKSLAFHLNDVDCPLTYEPSGEDFLSPCLMEADLMRRVLTQEEFALWLTKFLPAVPQDGSADWLVPGIVLDATDGKLVHLDGVNLSRAWALEGIASALPQNDQRQAALLAAASIHAETGLASVSGEHYSGGHWLGSFATYLVTRRGIAQ